MQRSSRLLRSRLRGGDRGGDKWGGAIKLGRSWRHGNEIFNDKDGRDGARMQKIKTEVKGEEGIYVGGMKECKG